MREFLKRYRVKLEVVTPLCIGTGQKIKRKEYMYFKEAKQVWVPNRYGLVRDLLKRKLDERYEEFLLTEEKDLYEWMKTTGYSDEEIQDICEYYLDCNSITDEVKMPAPIREFVKDPYGLPYIPGSTLKGALRTVLLGHQLLKSPDNFKEARKKVQSYDLNNPDRPKGRYWGREGKTVEYPAFHTLHVAKKLVDGKNDVLKGLRVSDSKPLRLEDLILCQKIDLSMEGGRKSIDYLRECLRPGTVVEFDLTVDMSILDLDRQKMKEAIKTVFDFYQQIFVQKFPDTNTSKKGNFYLGGGSGYGTKTIAYEVLEDEKRISLVSQFLDTKYKHNEHFRDVEKGISPHMLNCTNYNGQLVEYGKCQIEITEVSE